MTTHAFASFGRGTKARPAAVPVATALAGLLLVGPGISPSIASPGWVPTTAKEAVLVSKAGAGAPAIARCTDSEGLLGTAKDLAVSLEDSLQLAEAIPDDEEAIIGDRLEESLDAAFEGKVDLPEDVATYGAYVQRILDHLVPAQRRKLRYRIHIIRDDGFNAFALPGGVLGINTGTLNGPDAVRSEAELAAVIGHEIAHVELRHPIAIYQYLRSLPVQLPAAAMIVRIVRTPMQSAYEHRSDERGQEIAARRQYDPYAAARLWERLGRKYSRSSGGGLFSTVLGTADMMLSTHPPSRDRCRRTIGNAHELRKHAKVDRWYVGSTNVKRRIPGFVKAF